ncbi:MAG: T9SS type A sorting domain-containing protein [Ignavibacteria bacterium]|nr:T9SS type A sorting domain-containing protein [Ignavibacteria bacterium]
MKTFILSLLCIFCFTSNNFAQWTEQTSGINSVLYSVSAVDNNIVWACGEGGVVLRTIDAGLTWTQTTNIGSSIGLYTIRGIDALTALVGGASSTAGVVYKTIDGGVTWTQTFNQPGGFINAINKFNGVPVCGMHGDPVGGRWSQFISFDFGSTWDSTGIYNPAPPGEFGWNNSACQPNGVSYFIYYGTNNTKIYQPFANGTVLTHPTPGLVNSMAVWANAGDRLMTGSNIMLFSVDGGISWTDVNAMGTGSILGITGAGSTWFYVRGSSVYKSVNDGGSWSNDHTAIGTYNHISLSPLGLFIWAVRDNGGISRYLSDIPLPVELASFVSTVNGSNVMLNWSTTSEVNNAGFDIERSDVTEQTSGEWTKIGFVNGNGNSTEMKHFSFTDRGLSQGKYNYRLKQTDLNGNFAYYNLANEVIVGAPEKFSLSQNYPNPFNPSTKINYDLPFDANISLKVYDMTGKEVSKLESGYKTAGYYIVEFNASSLSTGLYVYRMTAESNGQSYASEKKMVLIK